MTFLKYGERDRTIVFNNLGIFEKVAGIIAEAIKHNVSLTVHETKYIDLGWTGIATSKQEWP